jgi:Cof subfamily protein (haloacid dehalogenase superfamily)
LQPAGGAVYHGIASRHRDNYPTRRADGFLPNLTRSDEHDYISRVIKLICVDVDGTMVGSSGVVRPEIWAAAERVRNRGLHLAICTGRPALGITPALAERLDSTGWHIFQNGASIFHLGNGSSRSQPLPAGALDSVINRAHETGRVCEVYTDTGYAIINPNERSRQHADLLGIPFEERPYELLRAPVVRAQWLLGEEEVEAVLAEGAYGLSASTSRAPIMPDTVFINLTAPGIDKASGVIAVAETYGIPLEHVMMVGDGGNDVTVMRLVGCPVAMANSEPEVLAVARERVGHVDDAGLVEAFELALNLT